MKRKELIFNTARKVIVENGLFDASIGKIAREADIPVGSVYTYYSSKEELINAIYVETKLEMGQYIFQPMPPDVSLKTAVKTYWERAVDFGLNHREKFNFLEQLVNSPLIQPTSQEQVTQNFEPVFELLQRGINEKVFKNMDLFLIHNLIYTNILGTIKYFTQFETPPSQQVKDQLFACCWDAISIH